MNFVPVNWLNQSLLFTGLSGRIVLLFLLVFVPFLTALAQPNLVLYNEDFEGLNPPWSLNIAGAGTSSGSNTWIINDEYNGNGGYPNTTPQTSTVSGNISFPGGSYLHIHDQLVAPGTTNANYNPANASDRFAHMTTGICTKGFDNVRFTFFYVGVGSFNSFGEVYYSIGGGPWTQIGPSTLNAQPLWEFITITDPAFENVNDLRFGFRWVNPVGIPPNTISLGVDDVFILGDFDQVNNPVTISVPTVPATVCQGSNMVFSYQLSDTLCNGNYSIELCDGPNVVNTWGLNINYPTTSGSIAVNVPTTVPVGNCYTIKVNRLGPAPVINGTASACIQVIACPNTISTLQPVVTIGAEAPNGIGVCVGSVIDVPFWSTGTFNPGNVYTAQLSDANGTFNAPQTIGTFASSETFDPTVVPNPGTVAGIIPQTTDGCNYFIRVISNNPNTTGTIWGPFCIKNCDIRTNGGQDIALCINQTDGDSTTITYGINTPPVTGVTYAPGNQFLVEVLNSTSFAQVNIGVIGSVTSTTAGNIQITIPNLPGLLALGMQPGLYYIRVVATNSSDTSNALGSLVRMTIGAPDENPPDIFKTVSTVCFGAGDIGILSVVGANSQSQYQWFLNGAEFPPNTPLNPLGVQFNGLPGNYIFTVQETNFGCVGPMSAPDTVVMITAPTANITGPTTVCHGDTSIYNVTFIENTAYGWSLSPANAGSIIINGADEITIVWDQMTSGTVTLNLDFASNQCGSTSGSLQITINESPVASAGNDVQICEGGTVTLAGNPTGSGGLGPYTYSWNNGGGTTDSATVTFPDTTMMIVTVTDANGCDNQDTAMVFVTAAPVANAGNDTSVCLGETLTLGGNPTGPPGSIFSWSPATGLSGTNVPNPTISPTVNSLFSVTVIDPNTNCTSTDDIAVGISSGTITNVPAAFICEDDSVVLDAGPGTAYAWSSGQTSQTIVANDPGVYSVVVTPTVGCGDVINYDIQEISLPDSVSDTLLCLDEELVIDGTVNLIAWEDGSVEQFLPVSSEGVYMAAIRDLVTGCPFNQIFNVTFDQCLNTLYFPNAFTPGSDNQNDFFGPKFDGDVVIEVFIIYNRWGEKVYESRGPEYLWDGHHNGKIVQGGVYVWYIEYFIEGVAFRKTGHVTAVRQRNANR